MTVAPAYPSVLVGFDGNNRHYPTLLTAKLNAAGFVEHTLAKEGPDEVRFLCHHRVPFKALSHKALSGFEAMHHIQVVEFEYDGHHIGALFFNSGRSTKVKTQAALKSLAAAANDLRDRCDYTLVMVVELGEGDADKSFEHRTLAPLLAKGFRSYFGNRRECVWVSRKAGKQGNQYDVIRGTSVAHQSPTRGQGLVTLERPGLLADVWHSPAGFWNGSRTARVKAALGRSWWRVFHRTDAAVEHWLLP